MKINLVSAILRGHEVMSINNVKPSTWALYYNICVNLNRMAWKTITLKTTLSGISRAINLQPYRTRLALNELVNLQLIRVQGNIDSQLTCTQLAISLCHEAYDDAISSTDKIYACINDMHDSLAAMHPDNAYRQPDTPDTQKISERAKKLLRQLKEYNFFDEDIKYEQKELPIKEKILINCIATDINKIAKGETYSMSITSERLLKEHYLNARHFIEVYM